MYFDIHSHILPAVDDGAKNLNEALKILKVMQSQGIEKVIATPHFYPADDNLEDFEQRITLAYKKLTEFSVKRKLPEVYLGCELLYYSGIGNSEDLSRFCLNNSSYLLLELTSDVINNHLFEDIIKLREKNGITPIIAHIERYAYNKKYKKLIGFLKEQELPVQINTSSILTPSLDRVIKKLLDSGLKCVLATDSHSVDLRPPYMAQALEYISSTYGKDYRDKLLENSEMLYKEIILGGEKND